MFNKILYLLVFVCLVHCSAAQVMIQDGAQLTATGNVQLVFDGINATNNDTQSDLSDGSIMIKGAANSYLDGSANWHVRGLIINKSSGMTMLGSTLEIEDSIRLVQGILDMNGQNILLHPDATIEGETEDNRIIGPGGGEIRITVPMNALVMTNPGKLGVIISSNNNLGFLTIKRSHQSRLPGNIAGVLRYYEIIPEGNSALQASVRFRYLDAELNGLAENDLVVLGNNLQDTIWRLEGQTGSDPVTNYVEKANLVLPGLYTLSVSNALPLYWGIIQAQCNSDYISLKWQTLQEQNTARFQIQRSDANSQQWDNIGELAAAGSSSSTLSYQFDDYDINPGVVVRYRIVATDWDGSKQYSPVVTVQGCDDPVTLKLFPVPVRNHAVTLSLFSPSAYQARIRIIGADGKQHQYFSSNVVKGNNQWSLQLDQLSPGIYYLQISMPDGKYRSISFARQ